jgi:hypothetical protein
MHVLGFTMLPHSTIVLLKLFRQFGIFCENTSLRVDSSVFSPSIKTMIVIVLRLTRMLIIELGEHANH